MSSNPSLDDVPPPSSPPSYEQGTYTDSDAAEDSLVIGMVGEIHSILVTVKSAADLKLVRGDDHLIVSVAGPNPDIIHLSGLVKEYCLTVKHIRHGPAPLEAIVANIHERGQRYVFQSRLRVYGEGMLISGADDTGPHLYHVEPSGSTWNLPVAAIGPNSHLARHYLERNLIDISNSSPLQLLDHGVRAMRESLGRPVVMDDLALSIVGYNVDTKTMYDANIFKGSEISDILI
ncbi:hypothetical protein KEM56_004448 [Ascosphaera pollenicola]|nr:hypothetical protein KEM56_004448 [Ascosphaera pollenicola]